MPNRFGISALSRSSHNRAYNEELMVDKSTGEMLIKTPLGDIISYDYLSRLSSDVNKMKNIANNVGLYGSIYLTKGFHQYPYSVNGDEYVALSNAEFTWVEGRACLVNVNADALSYKSYQFTDEPFSIPCEITAVMYNADTVLYEQHIEKTLAEINNTVIGDPNNANITKIKLQMKFNVEDTTFDENTVRTQWTSSALVTGDWMSVCYGGGKFVAVSYNSDATAYSTDGINWTASTLPNTDNWNFICCGGGKFVAIAFDSSNAAYSTDGINWTASTMPTSSKWQSVCYGGDKFVAVSGGYADNSTEAAYSTDGITWTASTLPISAKWYAVCYGDGKYVAVAHTSDISAYSTDGITWTSSEMPHNGEWCSVCYGGDKFVAVAWNSVSSAYSTDGITWESSALPNVGIWHSVCYGDGIFVAVEYGTHTVACSIDGMNWVLRTLPNAANLQSICYGTSIYVVLGRGGDIISTDHINMYRIIINDILVLIHNTNTQSFGSFTRIDSNADDANHGLNILKSVILGNSNINEYDSTNTYNISDKVFINDDGVVTVYSANEDNITGEFDPSKWNAGSLADLMGDITEVSDGSLAPAQSIQVWYKEIGTKNYTLPTTMTE